MHLNQAEAVLNCVDEELLGNMADMISVDAPKPGGGSVDLCG